MKSIFLVKLFNNIEKLKILIKKIYENQIKKLKDFLIKYYNQNYVERWFFSTNHKDIGTLYFIFGVFAGIIGTVFSVVNKNRISCTMVINFYKVIINYIMLLVTAHAFIMIFFMVMPSYNRWFW